MSKLQELIDRLCPDGVEFVKLNTLGTFENIGVDKKTVPGEPLVKLLNYVDVYKNKYINKDIPQMTVSSPQKKLDSCSIKQWDIFVTPTSETRDDIGHSAVSTEDIDGAVYSYHIMRFRLNNPNRVTACFINYLFESQEVQKQILKFASGQTRFGLSKYKFGDIIIPFPPIEVQEEIVKILDRFADYAAELQAELQARKEQYEYYRNLLLTFNPSACGCGTDGEQEIKVTTWGGYSYEITWKTMEEVCDFVNGFAFKSNLFRSKGERIIRITNITGSNVDVMDSKYFELNDYSTDLSKYRVQKGNILIAMSGATTGKIGCYNSNENSYINQRVGMFKPHNELSERFLFHFLSTITTELNILAGGGAQPNLSSNQLMSDVRIPIPPLELQEKIVAILDRFETLVNDLTQGMPAEIAAVKEQYEYYRNRLLAFNRRIATCGDRNKVDR